MVEIPEYVHSSAYSCRRPSWVSGSHHWDINWEYTTFWKYESQSRKTALWVVFYCGRDNYHTESIGFRDRQSQRWSSALKVTKTYIVNFVTLYVSMYATVWWCNQYVNLMRPGTHVFQVQGSGSFASALMSRGRSENCTHCYATNIFVF